MNSVLVWLSGHDPRVVAGRADAAEQHELAAMGVPVLFAAMVAGVCWAVAGHALLPAATQPWGTVAAGMFGLGVVLGVDRLFLHIADAFEVRWYAAVAFGVVRFGLTAIMSSVTAQALMPVLLKDELALHTLRMVERDDLQRHQALAVRYGVDDKAHAQQVAAQALTLAQAASREPPPEAVRRQLAAANQCVATHHRNLAMAPPDDSSAQSRAAQAKLQSEAQRCHFLAREAQAARSAHEMRMKTWLAEADQALQQARKTAADAQWQRDQRAQAALEAQSAATTPTSATVLADLLRHDAGARTKWLGITVLLLVLEALPLVLKSLRGRSSVGARLVLARRARLASDQAAYERTLMRSTTEARLAAAAQDGLDEALGSPALRHHFRDQAVTTLRAAGPIEALLEFSRKMDAGEQEICRHLATHPSHHAVASGWARAVRQAAEVMAAAAPLRAAPRDGGAGLSRVA